MNDSFKEYIEDGLKYYNTASKGRKNKPNIFIPDILYNLLAMSIEKFFMGVLVFKGDMADNHTFTDLINSAGRFMSLPDDFVRRLKELEAYQDICPVFEGYTRKKMDDDVIKELLSVATETKQMALDFCSYK
jgi:hypothetical protein